MNIKYIFKFKQASNTNMQREYTTYNKMIMVRKIESLCECDPFISFDEVMGQLFIPTTTNNGILIPGIPHFNNLSSHLCKVMLRIMCMFMYIESIHFEYQFTSGIKKYLNTYQWMADIVGTALEGCDELFWEELKSVGQTIDPLGQTFNPLPLPLFQPMYAFCNISTPLIQWPQSCVQFRTRYEKIYTHHTYTHPHQSDNNPSK